MRPTRPHLGLLAALALVLALVGCAETPGPGRLEAALVTSGVPEAQASCVVDAVEDVLDDDAVEALVERGASAAPTDDPKASDDDADRLRDAMAACRELAVATTTTVTVPIDEGTTTSVPRDGASLDTTAPEG